MKSVPRPHATSSGNLHPDGAIRCPWGIHSVLTDENDRVEVRARAAVRGDQLAALPLDELSRAFRAALQAAGVEFTCAEALVYPPEHDCNALIEAEGGVLDDPDVHVDWHMLPAEWRELQAVLAGTLDPDDSSYVQHLKASGALQ